MVGGGAAEAGDAREFHAIESREIEIVMEASGGNQKIVSANDNAFPR